MEWIKSRKGQVPIGVVITVAASLLLSAFGSFIVADNKSQDRDYDQIQRIASLEAQTKRIPYLEEKIDLLLVKQGIKVNENLRVENPIK